MDPLVAQARAIIAAALIVRGAVEVPSIPSGSSQGSPDAAGVRLRELTDYVYRLVTLANRMSSSKQRLRQSRGNGTAGARRSHRFGVILTSRILPRTVPPSGVSSRR